MIKDLIVKVSQEAIAGLWPNMRPDIVVEKPAHAEFGDYAINVAFRLAKEAKKSPDEVAEAIVAQLQKDLPSELEKVEVKAGYINFFLSQEYLQNTLAEIARTKDTYGQSDLGQAKTVIVEYPSTNIAKPLHIGHSRTAFIGDALASIHEAVGYKVIRWDYLGDWGTAFGKLLAAYKMWGVKEEIEQKPIETMLALYVRFSAEAKDKPELEDQARAEFKKLEEGDGENKKLWQWFKDESLKETNRIYKVLGLHDFDVTIGESFYEKDMQSLVAELLEQGIAKESEGAIVVEFEKESLPTAMLQKSDGASLYLTRDIANLRYRLKEYQPTKILYVVANQQSLHFEQLFAIAQLLGLTSAELTHIKYGMVLGEDKKKFATREGKAIFLEDVIKEAIERAHKIVSEKNPDLSDDEKQEIAETVAIGALKYNDLKEYRTTDIVFDWDRILDFNGQSGPYLQYTYARLASIVAKAGERGDGTISLLTETYELNLIKQLLEFPEALVRSAETYAPNHLALYLYELGNAANQLYETTPILSDDNLQRRDARLLLIETALEVLKKGLSLLGIRVLDTI